MPRPKGSKNKVKSTNTQPIDFTSLIAEKSSTKDALVADIATLEENVNNLKTELKAQKTELKKLDTEITKLEAKKAKADAKAAEEAKKTEAESVLKKLLASGMSADEILEKLT